MTEPTERVATGKVVTFHYTLTSASGEVIDQSDGEPMPYLHGAGNIVPGLEREMEGKAPGAKFRSIIEPVDGYGEHDPDGEVQVPRSAFPEDAPLEAGVQFVAEQPDGDVVPLWITAVEDDAITVDKNHPLAGEQLTFDIEIVAIRDATADEKTHGHVHGTGCSHH